MNPLKVGILFLSFALGGCAGLGTGSTRAAELRHAGSPPAAAAVEHHEGLRSPYGWGYRVGFGYAYRHWTW